MSVLTRKTFIEGASAFGLGRWRLFAMPFGWKHGGKPNLVFGVLADTHFRMDSESIQLVRSEKVQRLMNAAAPIVWSAGNAKAGAMLAGAAASGFTMFRNVLSMKERPKYDAVNLVEVGGANQIWIPREDYAFVADFLRQHLKGRP